MIRLITFLGNKGTQYARTRHNSGWMLCDVLERDIGTVAWQEKFHGHWGKMSIGGAPVMVLKPMTFMNESGRSVGAAQRFFNLDPQEILVVHDDLELPFRSVKLQSGGGLGGHNGLRSIKDHLGSTAWYRLRIGIGRPVKGTVSSYVLSRFDPMEEALLDTMTAEARTLLETWIERKCPSTELPLVRTAGS